MIGSETERSLDGEDETKHGERVKSETKKCKQDAKRLRDIERLLRNQKIKLDEKSRAGLEKEAESLKSSILERRKRNSSNKKLNRYLEYKRKKQKTMRFVELVKVKRKINRLQKELVLCIENKDNDRILEIKSEVKLFKSYEDYIRLSPFFKDRKYIPLFSSTQLDSDSIRKREEFIEDVKNLKEKLRLEKCKMYNSEEYQVKDSFLLDDDTPNANSNFTSGEKIEYKLNFSNHKHNKPDNRDFNHKPKRPLKGEKNPSFNTTKDRKDKPPKLNNESKHILFSDSD